MWSTIERPFTKPDCVVCIMDGKIFCKQNVISKTSKMSTISTDSKICEIPS